MSSCKVPPAYFPANIALAGLVLVGAAMPVVGAEFAGNTAVLPPGTELGEEVLERPREVFRSEMRGGRQSYLDILGDVAFNSPSMLGSVARQAGISCDTCHVNGTTNPRLFIPGLALRPGTFDTTSQLFNPKTDDGVLDALTTPSLRGAHLLAPYGHDGRTPSLREFVRNVIVNEFNGPDPSREILDALVVYIEDIDFVPNPRLTPSGKLVGPLTDAERRGEGLFYRPFAHDQELSCAGCHDPNGAFTDHRQHDVGSGGGFKTPTLRNANFNAPYFHDGRYTSYAQVVAHFDRMFYLGFSAQDRRDLVAYLQAIGDGEQGLVPDSVDARLKEIATFTTVLDTAIPELNGVIVTLTVDTIDRELRELTEYYPERKDPAVAGGVEQRAAARGALKELVLGLRAVDRSARGARFDEAATALGRYRDLLAASVPVLKSAELWSLFNREVHDAHFAALRQLYLRGIDPTSAVRPRLDVD